jgi:integrase
VPYALPTNLPELSKVVSVAIANAPLTCCDPLGDGRWKIPSVQVLSYLGRIENQSLRDVMALWALLRADREQSSTYRQITYFVGVARHIMVEQAIDNIVAADANDLLFRIHIGQAGKGLSEYQRRRFLSQWSAVRSALDEYAESLTAPQLEKMKGFFIGSITDRRKFMRHKTFTAYLREQRERVKTKTDAVQSKFYQIRHLAAMRCNQVRRLFDAVQQAIKAVAADHACPYEFSYDETVFTGTRTKMRQRVDLTLWDSNSLRDHAIALGYKEAPATTLQRRWREGSFSEKNRSYFVSHNGTRSLTKNCPAEPFWFLEFFRNHVFRHLDARLDSDLAERRQAFYRQWGYETRSAWDDDSMLVFGPTNFRPIDFVQAREGHEFIPYEGLYAACMFGGLMVRMGTITGARIGEVLQIAQSPECFKQLENVGPKRTTRWVLRLIPKGRKKREDYFIDEDSKRHLVDLIRFQTEKCGYPLLPIVPYETSKLAEDRYVLQWNRQLLSSRALNTFLRFVLHGMIFRSYDGAMVHLSSHLLRHSFATEMADLKVSIDVIAKLLHQRDQTVTRYYSQPTVSKVMNAAEMIFVDRIDLGAEGRRSPEEIGRMLKDAEGKIGALTEVFGGTCVVSNMCPAKFVCVGCAGNAPDPDKRYQIDQKMAWAEQQLKYAQREKLVAEERTMKQLLADCRLIKEEMDLIDAARSDGRQIVSIQDA